MRIESERLYLRPFNASDGELLWQLHSDPEVMKYTRKERALTREESQQDLLEKTIKNKVWAAFKKEDDFFVGWFGIWASDEFANEPELGFMTVNSQWGRGYSTEASRALLKHSSYPRVNAVTAHANVASQNVLAKLGFQLFRDELEHRHFILET